MRAIEEHICSEFILHHPRKQGNTESTGDSLKLFGNTIAEWGEDGKLYMTLGDHPTPTTRSRLNALLTLLGSRKGFWQERGVQYFGNRDRSGMFTPIRADQWLVW